MVFKAILYFIFCLAVFINGFNFHSFLMGLLVTNFGEITITITKSCFFSRKYIWKGCLHQSFKPFNRSLLIGVITALIVRGVHSDCWIPFSVRASNAASVSMLLCHHDNSKPFFHYSDIIMSMMASHITGVFIVCSIVCSGADQRKHQSCTSLPLWGESTGDRWIPLTKGKWHRKCFHLMTSSCFWHTHSQNAYQYLQNWTIITLHNDMQPGQVIDWSLLVTKQLPEPLLTCYEFDP